MSDQPPHYPSYPGPTPSHGAGPNGDQTSPSPSRWPSPTSTPTPRGAARPLEALTGWTIATSILFSLVPVVGVALVWDARSTWLAAADENRSALDILTPYELSWMLLFPLGIAAYVVTCLWLYRARSNVEVLSPASWHARSRGWVWGGWVVPFVSLWFPFQVVRDVLRVRERPDAPRVLLGWWWAWFIAAFVISRVESELAPWDEIDRVAVDAIVWVSVVGAVTMVIACVLWIRVVLAVAQDQRALLERAGEPPR